MNEENSYELLEKYIMEKTPEMDRAEVIRHNEPFCVKTKRGIGTEYTRNGRANEFYW
ncbi:hypothetical protein JW707_03070 [Candidatus Woesearchaeota archaeon]|nr:hypothetical protein [Candidatus Woesearchaeota archaeon]